MRRISDLARRYPSFRVVSRPLAAWLRPGKLPVAERRLLLAFGGTTHLRPQRCGCPGVDESIEMPGDDFHQSERHVAEVRSRRPRRGDWEAVDLAFRRGVDQLENEVAEIRGELVGQAPGVSVAVLVSDPELSRARKCRSQAVLGRQRRCRRLDVELRNTLRVAR